MNVFAERLLYEFNKLIEQFEGQELAEKIWLINECKKSLHKASPFKNEPVDCVIWVPTNDVVANEYNPNSVAPPEMQLLEVSIINDGYTQPIVTWIEGDKREIFENKKFFIYLIINLVIQK